LAVSPPHLSRLRQCRQCRQWSTLSSTTSLDVLNLTPNQKIGSRVGFGGKVETTDVTYTTYRNLYVTTAMSLTRCFPACLAIRTTPVTLILVKGLMTSFDRLYGGCSVLRFVFGTVTDSRSRPAWEAHRTAISLGLSDCAAGLRDRFRTCCAASVRPQARIIPLVARPSANYGRCAAAMRKDA
jgi:hypothetical protein